jgi:arylsulfatase
MASWESIPEDERPFQRRLMEVFAGFTEHADYNAGRVIDEIERQGKLDNTLIFYIWGDNGSSSEGLNGTISEQLAQNGIPTKISQHLEALKELGGLDALGGPKTDNMYHAGWAWAGSTPYQGTKLQGAYFGGIRQPLAVSWPKRIPADPTARPQFHHVIDVVPTIYELTRITAPRIVNGFEQDSFDGVSMVYAFDDPKAPGMRKTQFFDIMASRGIYHDGWFASASGPREPWVGGMPKGIKEWSPLTDKWELYDLEKDWSQANDLAASNPQKLEEMKDLFLLESTKNKNLPIGRPLVHRHVPSGGRSRVVAHRVDVRRSDDPDARIRGSQARKGRQPRDHGRRSAAERQRRAVRAGRLLRRRHVLREGRHPQLRVQPVRGSTHEDQGEGEAADGQGQD